MAMLVKIIELDVCISRICFSASLEKCVFSLSCADFLTSGDVVFLAT